MMKKEKAYDLEERLLGYSVRIIEVVDQLPKSRTGNHVAGQLLKSGTSPYPNHGEAQAAESSKDFVHKLRISLKELRETQRWLRLIERVPLITKIGLLNEMLQETEELIKIFVASIKTAAKKHKLAWTSLSTLIFFWAVGPATAAGQLGWSNVENRTSNEVGTTLRHFINRHHTLFDVGRWRFDVGSSLFNIGAWVF